jgi:hypothetical protein
LGKGKKSIAMKTTIQTLNKPWLIKINKLNEKIEILTQHLSESKADIAAQMIAMLIRVRNGAEPS